MDSTVLQMIAEKVPEVAIVLPFVGEVNLTPYVAAGVVFIALTAIFWLVRKVVILRLQALSEKTSTDVDDVLIDAVSSIHAWYYTLVALYAALTLLTLPHGVDMFMRAVFWFVTVWQAIETATCFIDYATKRFLEKDEDGDGVTDPASATASDMVTLLAKIVLWVFGVIFVFSNLGIEVTSLVAGLGIGGIAVAFALQGILSDLFSSFSLYFDKPFRVGDYIVIGQDSGTVEKIGIKTTRIRTLQGEELVVSNAELTTTRVQNFKKLKERRVSFKFGILYETPKEKVKEVNAIIEEIFKRVMGGRLDRVHFTGFGDSALLFEVVYYVESNDYVDYLDIQEQMNHELLERFADKGIEFAYPTQTVYTKKVG